MKEKDFFEEPVKVPIEPRIDLHTFAPRDIPDLLESYLEECYREGLREVRIIHGKGIGVQRKIVHAFLQKSPLVETFFQAPPEAGGWGATIAVLKSP
jgi:dsDNA-specific endonuclease/ATPase MutS2